MLPSTTCAHFLRYRHFIDSECLFVSVRAGLWRTEGFSQSQLTYPDVCTCFSFLSPSRGSLSLPAGCKSAGSVDNSKFVGMTMAKSCEDWEDFLYQLRLLLNGMCARDFYTTRVWLLPLERVWLTVGTTCTEFASLRCGEAQPKTKVHTLIRHDGHSAPHR